jgi:predicted nucleic acid-binding protein
LTPKTLTPDGSMALCDLQAGSRVFVDATILVYHFTGASAECRDFLLRCQRRELEAATSALVLAEVGHRLMMIEASSRGLVTAGNLAKKLRRAPEVVQELMTSRRQVEQIPLMGIRVLGLELHHVMAGAQIRAETGLLTNDSLIAATALFDECPFIASADKDFQRVPDLTVASPTVLP